jgi:hypothetical protein
MITYDDCDGKTYQMIKSTMAQYHPDLAGADVTVRAVFAHNEDKDGNAVCAVKAHGHTAAAKIQVTSLQDRARGLADCKLTIDHYSWERMAESRRIALIDHELEHLELKTDDDGVVYDDRNRPKLKCKLHDWLLAGFASIIERHGEAAVEHREMIRWQETWGQLSLFPMVGTTEARTPGAALRESIKKVLRPGKGIDKVTITSHIPGQEDVTISSEDLKD